MSDDTKVAAVLSRTVAGGAIPLGLMIDRREFLTAVSTKLTRQSVNGTYINCFRLRERCMPLFE